MNLIAAVDGNWAIGYNGKLLYRIPEDLKRFSILTKESGTVIMGRKTYESIGKPLPGRKNIVITNNYDEDTSDVIYCSFPYSLDYIKENNLKNVFVIGGAQIYKLYLCLCRHAYITKIDSNIKSSDSYFPNLDLMDNWIIEEESESYKYEAEGIRYKFVKYKNKNLVEGGKYGT